MAIIKCPECGREVSDKATACPQCGAPVQAHPLSAPAPPTPVAVAVPAPTAEKAKPRRIEIKTGETDRKEISA